VPVPGAVNVPTALIVVVTAGLAAGGSVVPPDGAVVPPGGGVVLPDEVTGIETAGALDGLAWPAVVTVAVGAAALVAPDGMAAVTVTGGRLPPGCAVADVVQVTRWPLVVQVQPSPVAADTVWPAGMSNVSFVVPVTGPAPAPSVTFAWYVAVPGEVKLPTGEIDVATCGSGTAWITILSVAELPACACWPAVPADAVTGMVPVAEGATEVVTAIGG
jgi:hypothetical protein